MSLDISIVPVMNLPIVTAAGDFLQTEKQPLLALISGHHDEIIERLNQYGAILFRGFACDDEDYFSKAIELCGLGTRCSTTDYDLSRTLLKNEVYTSSDLPAHIPLPLHHEKPRSKKPPNHLYFCCVIPAQKGGGTLFANAESIWLAMPKNIKDKILEHGVVYRQFLHGKSFKYHVLQKMLGSNFARSWAEYFGTDDKRQIEKKLEQNKSNWSWINNGQDLILLNYLPGALKHPMTQNVSWFNSAAYLNYYSNTLYDKLNELRSYKYVASHYMIAKDMFPMICHYGNGQAFSAEEIGEINRIIQQHTWVLKWKKGDFIIVDNFTFMHGKQAHEGDRLLYSCMTEMH
ncbi:MAG: TauD/TfdA family dioxygenase [Legionella sp.]|uniref:TauD/TfdA family dioxygenase n=1 Tax=Legionella sp. TaxID=459 RepID=UPI0039E448C8